MSFADHQDFLPGPTGRFPHWVDVTATCEEASYEGGGHINRGGQCWIPCPIGYRFRKVKAVTLCPDHDAFIIEKKES